MTTPGYDKPLSDCTDNELSAALGRAANQVYELQVSLRLARERYADINAELNRRHPERTQIGVMR